MIRPLIMKYMANGKPLTQDLCNSRKFKKGA